MRLFFAINLPNDVREHLRQVQSVLRDQITARASWTRGDQFHITVKFLGECDEGKYERLAELVKTTQLVSVGSMRGTDLEMFPPRRPTRILAAKLSTDRVESLALAHQRLEEMCAELGFAKEGRALRPHVTFARIRIPKRIPLTAIKAAEGLFPGPAFVPTGIDLMESKLSPNGSHYTRLASIALHQV